MRPTDKKAKNKLDLVGEYTEVDDVHKVYDFCKAGGVVALGVFTNPLYKLNQVLKGLDKNGNGK